ncbi:MAG: response regulator [Xenococcaceae cyanobacterium]
MRILLVDDDESLISVLKKRLVEENYLVDVVGDGEQGWIYGSTYTYDLIVLDLMLPKIDGINLCKRFRAHGYHMPIMLLTGRNTSEDKIKGLDAGADDYVVKPFHAEELAARIRALLRRANSNSLPILSWGDLRLNPRSYEVTYDGQLLSLTAKEYALLELFLRHSDEVFSIDEIIDNLWSSEEYPAEATVRSHLRRLRRKLKAAGATEDLIETVRGLGYRLKLEPKDTRAKPKTLVQLETADKRSKHLQALGIAWEKYQEKRQSQLANLQQVVKALRTETCSGEFQEQGRLAAHSLAGNLGIFGFERGSELAREIEKLLQPDTITAVKQLASLEALLVDLFDELREEQPTEQLQPQFSKHAPLLLIIDEDAYFSQQIVATAHEKGMRTAVVPILKSAKTWISEILNKQEQQSLLPDAILLILSFPKPTVLGANDSSWSEYLYLIGQLHQQVPSLPIVVIAAQDSFQERLEVARQGGWFFLKQPATPKQVIAFVQQVLERFHTEEKVMIVDDDLEFLRVLPSLLRPWGFKVTTLDDSRQFWDVLRAVTPSLLVLDVDMPHINGIELCQVLRTHPYWCRLPVLFLSVHTDLATQNQVFAAGADDFVSKPAMGKELANRILNRLERVRLWSGNIYRTMTCRI